MLCTYVLDDHDQERKLDGQSLLGINGAGNVVGGDISSHDFDNRGLNIGIRYSFDVSITDIFLPNLERLGAKFKNQS